MRATTTIRNIRVAAVTGDMESSKVGMAAVMEVMEEDSRVDMIKVAMVAKMATVDNRADTRAAFCCAEIA